MGVIWKYPLGKDQGPGSLVKEMPIGAEILTVQLQGDEPVMWARVDPDAKLQHREFKVHWTGLPFVDTVGRYISTWQEDGLVYHLFEVEK